MDGSGMHCQPTTILDVSLSPLTAWNLSVPIEESPVGRELLKRFAVESQRKMSTSLIRRMMNKLYHFMSGQ